MKNIVTAISEFDMAMRLLTWIQEQKLQIGSDTNVGEMAFDFAIRYEDPTVIEAFVAVASSEATAAQRRSDSTSKRKFSAKSDQDSFRETARLDGNITQGRLLASAMSVT